MAILKRSTLRKSETKIVPDTKDGLRPYIEEELMPASLPDDTEGAAEAETGQLALDVFQTADEIVIVAPIAGVKLHDFAITVTDEVLTIKGQRNMQFKASSGDYFTQECFWGSFSRSIILPESVDTARIQASFKNGILIVRVPKVEKIRTRMVKIVEE